MKNWATIGLLSAGFGLLAIDCAIRGLEYKPGTEGGACYGNATCNEGLRCVPVRAGNLCVKPYAADGGCQ